MDTQGGSRSFRAIAIVASLGCMVVFSAVIPAWGGGGLSSSRIVLHAPKQNLGSAHRVSRSHHRRHPHPAPQQSPVLNSPLPAPEAGPVTVSDPIPPPGAPAPAPQPAPKPKPAPRPPPPPTPALTPAPNPAPAPPPAPAPKPPKTTPPPVPSGTPLPGVIFRATHLRDFWLNQSEPGAITEVPDPAGSGETVFKFTVGDNDKLNITPNPRAELLSPHTIKAGDEFWWSAKVFLPTDFPASTPNFVNLLQGPYGEPWQGSPPFLIKVEGSSLKWQRNTTYDWDVPWETPLVRNQWVRFLLHERFGSDGWIEMWVNGQPITFFGSGSYNPNNVAPTQHLAMATMDSSNNAQPNSLYLQSYRKKGMFPSLTVYQGPLTIGSSKLSVGG